jgi:hypothetical protein
MDTHSIMPIHYPKSLRIESLLRVVRRFVLAAVILPTFTAVPVLLADTPPTFTSANNVTFPQGIRDRFTVTTTGIPVPKITLTGHLPAGLKFVDNGDGTATLSGRPGNGLGQVGDYNLTFTASNGVAPNATQNFTLTVTRPPLITSVNNATFVIGTANTFTVTTRNTQPKTTLSFTGSLPGGVTFVPSNNGTATLSGTPAPGSQGIYSLTITGTNGFPPDAVQMFTLTVQGTAPVTHAPTITSTASTTFTVGTEGIFTIHTTGTPTSSIALSGTLPAWLTFVDNTDGSATLDGIPDSGGPPSYSLTITATNGIAPNATQTFTLFVNNPPPAITSADNTTFVVGTFASFTVRTSPPDPSATVSFNGTLPLGINFTPNSDGTATIDGTASVGSEGSYPINIKASNGTLPDAMQTFTITVQDAPPVLEAPAITSAASTSFTVGTAGNFTITTTGSPTPTLTLDGAQPAWLSFVDNTDGTATLSGTPDAGSDLSYSFTVTARNGVSPVATQDFTLGIIRTSTAYDFNADGKPDYVLDNAVTHQTAVWYLNNNVFVAGAFGPTLPANWNVVGVADFDGDGKPDYMLFNSSTHQTAIWYLSGTTFVRGAFGPTLPNSWDLVAVGDFNADGKPDYVLYNAVTRQTAVWYLNNNVFVGGAFGPTLPPSWKIVGVADFDGDNKPDYCLLNSTSQQTAIWYLSGTSFVRGAFGPSLPNGWDLVEAADFDRDGKPDYALFNAVTHQTAVWYLNNNAFTSGLFGPTLPAPWSLIAP